MSMLLFCECKLIKTLKLFQNFKWLAKAIQDTVNFMAHIMFRHQK